MTSAIDEGLKSEEQFRDTASEEYTSPDIGTKLVVVRDPRQYLFLELDRVLVAAFGDVEVGNDAVFVFDLEPELTNFVGWTCHDDVSELVEKEDIVLVA